MKLHINDSKQSSHIRMSQILKLFISNSPAIKLLNSEYIWGARLEQSVKRLLRSSKLSFIGSGFHFGWALQPGLVVG